MVYEFHWFLTYCISGYDSADKDAGGSATQDTENSEYGVFEYAPISAFWQRELLCSSNFNARSRMHMIWWTENAIVRYVFGCP